MLCHFMSMMLDLLLQLPLLGDPSLLVNPIEAKAYYSTNSFNHG